MPTITSQSGALFGLDARIALVIFSVLSVVAGVAVVVNIDSTRGQVLATELSDTGTALEHIHTDLKTDIFLALTNPSGKNAFQALYDNSVLRESDEEGNLRARWNGPYIKYSSNINNRYGEMLLTKAGADHNQPCNGEDLCYLYLVYSHVKPGIAKDANKVLDGETEKSPEKEGRLQWTPSADDAVTIYYRATRALSPNLDF
jgi:hypothetical protein